MKVHSLTLGARWKRTDNLYEIDDTCFTFLSGYNDPENIRRSMIGDAPSLNGGMYEQ